jgi:hypothetical protein
MRPVRPSLSPCAGTGRGSMLRGFWEVSRYSFSVRKESLSNPSGGGRRREHSKQGHRRVPSRRVLSAAGVIGHMCDVSGGIPPEVRNSLCSICARHQLVDRVRKTAHQRDRASLSSGPSKTTLATWVAIERCAPVIHPRSIPLSDVRIGRGSNYHVSLSPVRRGSFGTR